MSEASGKLWSKEWWLSAVLIGVAVHLVASYLKPRIDATARQVALWWATRSQDRLVARNTRIADLRSNPEKRMFAGINELRSRLRSIQALMYVFVFMAVTWLAKEYYHFYLGSLALAALTLAYLWLFMSDFSEAMRIKAELREALQAIEASQALPMDSHTTEKAESEKTPLTSEEG